MIAFWPDQLDLASKIESPQNTRKFAVTPGSVTKIDLSSFVKQKKLHFEASQTAEYFIGFLFFQLLCNESLTICKLQGCRACVN